MPLTKISILRPSLLLGHRHETRLLEDLSQYLCKVFAPLLPKNFKSAPVEASKVAHTMVEIAESQTEKIKIYDNLYIQQTK